MTLAKWILDNYENTKLEAKAIKEMIDLCMEQSLPQNVVNDALQSFRDSKVDENLPTEKRAKEVLIKLSKTKFMEEEDKGALIHFLVLRNVEGYEADYSYIFDKQIA